MNGLTLATRLALSDLGVGVFERAPVPGGQCRSDASLAPGFRHEPHATFLNYLTLAPVPLRRWWSGARLVAPEVQHAIVFAGGDPGIAVHSLARGDATRASIARHSPTDSRTFARLQALARKVRSAYGRLMYAPPSTSALTRYSETVSSVLPGGLASRSAAELIEALFQSSAVQTLLLRLSGELGPGLEEPGGAAAFVGTVMALLGTRSVPLGGMSEISAAMTRTAARAGVELHLQRDVRQIVVERGRATGVVLDDGTRVQARHAVASSAPLGHTLCELVGDGNLDDRDRRRVRRLARAAAPTLASQPFCLREPPRYRSARGEPDVDRSAQVFIGFDTPEEALAGHREVAAGGLPRPGGAIAHHSLWDPGCAPVGQSAASVTTLFPEASSVAPGVQRRVSDAYPRALLERWREYAPNLTPDAVIAMRANPLHDGDRAIALVGGEDEYATSVQGCYVCGTATFPGGGVHGACGWNAAEVILRRLRPRAALAATHMSERMR